MKSLIVYESMYGNTHAIAERIGDGLRRFGDVEVLAAADASAQQVAAVDLLVVGGPTHVHGMTSTRSRDAAAAAAAKTGSTLTLDPAAHLVGLREWFDDIADNVDGNGRAAAAFDTRMAGPALITGRASHGIAQRLRHHHYRIVIDPQSFLISRDNHLAAGEGDNARAWGESLGRVMAGMMAKPDA